VEKRALIAASVASHAERFCMNDARLLREFGYEVDVACNFETGSSCSPEQVRAFEERLNREGYGRKQIDFDRGALHLRMHVRAFRQLKSLIADHDYDVIHCTTPIGGAICRAAARKTRRQGAKVLYTAHGFHFFKGAPLKNWLLFYPVEKLCARWTDVLITINREDFDRAKRKLHAKRVEYVPGVGIDLKRFREGKYSSEDNLKTRAALGVSADDKLLLSVGELNENKNHETVIRALAELNRPKLRYVICGCGPLEEYLRRLAVRLGLAERVVLAGYRTDVDRLYACADLFVLPSLREGLPVVLMEALASGLPAVCSDTRGNDELTEKNARFPQGDAHACAEKLREYLFKDNTDEIKRNLAHLQEYGADAVTKRMREIYKGVLEGKQ
jgi:glycosyltransferase involved in cell wall biosynthesis